MRSGLRLSELIVTEEGQAGKTRSIEVLLRGENHPLGHDLPNQLSLPVNVGVLLLLDQQLVIAVGVVLVLEFVYREPHPVNLQHYREDY